MMKKILVLGAIVSSLAFAKGFNNTATTGQGVSVTQNNNYSKISALTGTQQKELADLKTKHQKDMAPLMLSIQEKDLAVKKELLADKPNWTKIESIIKEKESLETKRELQMLKNRTEIKEKFGLDFGNGFGKNQGIGKGKACKY